MRRRRKYDDILTPREWEVLELVREGLTNEEIADRLGISFGTAKYHVAEVLSKLGVSSRQEAVRLIEEQKPVWAAHPWLSLPGLGSIAKGRTAWRITIGLGAAAAAGSALLLFLALGWLGGESAGDEARRNLSLAVGMDIAPESLRALEQARLNTPYRHTILLAKGELSNLGTEHTLLASLPKVETIAELQAALSYDINLIVIDQSAASEIAGTNFLFEQWQAGRAIMGLNLCFADLPDPQRSTNPDGGLVWEISPTGETRYYDTTNLPQPPSRCSWADAVAQAGHPYLSYLPRRPNLQEMQILQDRGENRFSGGGTGRLDLPAEASCFVRELLSRLDEGTYMDVVPEHCD
ncbi:MAG: hypothetical protein GEU75_10545 [Dehalococcoidia bacterium]|nr:hypothetical protein [Dehalococcoidia bacterium]